jgi:cytochrome P450
MISKRRAQQSEEPIGRDRDLLDLFMAAKTEEGDPLNDAQLRDVVLNFIIAGRDTTAQALSWSFWLLSTRPEILAKLRDEAHKILGSSRMAAFADMKDLVYAHAVFYEVLRLYPSVPMNVKVCNQDDVLPVCVTIALIARMVRLCQRERGLSSVPMPWED